METIFITIGLSLVFIFFLNLMNANFLKERRMLFFIIKDLDPKYHINYKSELTVAKRYHNAWHKWKLFLMVFIAGIIGIVVYLDTFDTGGAILAGFLSGLFFWTGGDIILNKFMNWKLFERGNKSGMDIIPFWVRFVLLTIVIVIILSSCESPQQKAPEKIGKDFVKEAQAKSALLIRTAINPYNGEVYHYFDGNILGDTVYDRLMIEGDSIQWRFATKYLTWQLDHIDSIMNSIK